MKKNIKRAVSFLFATVLAFSFTSAAFAFNGLPRQIMPLSNGIENGTVTINGKDYSATFSLTGSTNGCYSKFATVARCIRDHHTVYVTFITDTGGYQRFSGGEKSYKGTYDNSLKMYVGLTGTTQSNSVKYGGLDEAVGIMGVSATLTATTISQQGVASTFNFSTSAS